MNELTKDKICDSMDLEYEDVFLKEDVILAVEETIKRIEEKGKEANLTDKQYIIGLHDSLKIIKEQFPILSMSCQHQQEDEK